jgi:hypothetical protein
VTNKNHKAGFGRTVPMSTCSIDGYLNSSFLQNSRLKNAAPAHLRFSRVF